MSEKFEKEVIERMELIVKLLSQTNLDPEAPQTESIIRLSKIGLKPSQIADVLNTSSNYVNVILSQKRKGMKQNEKQKT